MNTERGYSTIDWSLQLDPAGHSIQQHPIIDSTSCISQQQPSMVQHMFMAIPTPYTNDMTISKGNNMENLCSNTSITAVNAEQYQRHLGTTEINFGHNMNKRQVDNSKQQQQQANHSKDNTLRKKRTNPSKHRGGEPLSVKLDFRPTMPDQVPDSQLKSMSLKQRRQLRNRISARNFRNRRKEYVIALEEELENYKQQNNKLHMDLTTIQQNMDKLDGENQQLRLDLILCEQGIPPATSEISSNMDTQIPQQPPNSSTSATGSLSSFEVSPSTVHALSLDSSASPPDWDILYDSSYHRQTDQQQQQQQHVEQQHPSNGGGSAATSTWNMSVSSFNLCDMYLSHAIMPDWDVNRMLSKESERSSPIARCNDDINDVDLFQRFPLLAPTLASIVVGHAMTPPTNDLLSLSSPVVKINNHGVSADIYTGFDDKRASKVWELLQPLATISHHSTSFVQPPSSAMITDGQHQQHQRQQTPPNDQVNMDGIDGTL